MKELVLIRHGSTALGEEQRFCGLSNPPLSRRGTEEIESLRQRISVDPADLFLSSDLLRCSQTAAMISPNREPIFLPALREIGFGMFEGLTAHECKTLFPSRWNRWCSGDTVAASGESEEELIARVEMELENWRNSPCDRVIAVTHSGVIRVILALLITQSKNDLWRFKIETGTVCRIGFDSNYAFLLSLNEK